MRILFWCEPFPPEVGGIPTIAADIVASLLGRGHSCDVVAGGLPASLSVEPPFEAAIHRFPFLEVLQARNAGRIGALARSIATLKRELRPDLVLAFALTPSLFFHHLTRDAWPAPLLVTLHGSLPYHGDGAASLVGRTLDAADWIMACSEGCLKDAVDLHPSIAGRASVVRNALRCRASPTSPLELDPLRLLFVGRLSPEKGADLAIAAMPAVLEQQPAARLRIVGDGPAAGDLRNRIGEIGLAAQVEITGFVAPQEVSRHFAEASMVVVPSRQEGFSLVALEAAGAGRPVVATKVGGIPEVVVDGESGVLVAPDDPLALAEAILALAADPGRARALAANARRRAESAFRWSDYVDAYDHRIRALGAGA